MFEIINSLDIKKVKIKYFHFNNIVNNIDTSRGIGWSECNLINFVYKKYPKDDFLKISGRYI